MRSVGHLGIDVVHGCQLRCIGCPNSTIAPKVRHMAPENLRRVLTNLDTIHRLFELRLYNYGEPFLHPQLPDLLEIVHPWAQRWRTHDVSISTNGQVTDPHRIEQVVTSPALKLLIVSCDGDGTPRDYERLRPPAKWDKLMQFLEIAATVRRRKNPHLRIAIRTVIEHRSAVERWTALVVPMGYATIFRTWKPLPTSTLTKRKQWDTPAHGRCDWASRNDVFIDWDGELVPCCAHPHAASLGNLTEKPLSELLKSRREFFAHMNTNRQSMPICGRCNVRADTPRIEPGLLQD